MKSINLLFVSFIFNFKIVENPKILLQFHTFTSVSPIEVWENNTIQFYFNLICCFFSEILQINSNFLHSRFYLFEFLLRIFSKPIDIVYVWEQFDDILKFLFTLPFECKSITQCEIHARDELAYSTLKMDKMCWMKPI